MKRTRWAMGAAVLVLAATAAGAGEPIHEEASAAKDGEVRIENLAGSVVVTAWDEGKVLVDGTLGDGADRLEVEEDDGDVSIRVVLPRRSRHHVEDTDLVVRVPRGSSVGIETVSASVEIGGVRGDVEIETVSGSVQARDLAAVEIETVSGAIDVAEVSGPVEASSVSGTIEVEDCGEWLEASTTSGDIDLGGVPGRVECETTSGRVTADIDPVKDGSYRFDCFSGDVTIRLPADLDAAIDVETFSGRIRSEFDGRSRDSRHGPGAYLSVREGDASADITVSTFSGGVRLEKR